MKPKAQVERAIDMLLTMRPRDKATFITRKGIYQVDYNYNPPRVTKLKMKGKK